MTTEAERQAAHLTPSEASLSSSNAMGADPPLASVTSRRAWIQLKIAIATLDLFCVGGAMAAALWLCTVLPASRIPAYPDGVVVAGISLPFVLLAMLRVGLYRTHFIASRIEEFRLIVRATALSTLAMAVVAFALRLDIARSWLILTFGIGTLLLTIERKLVREMLLRARRRGHFLHRAVIIGDNLEALGLCQALGGDPYLGYDVLGFLSDSSPLHTPLWANYCVIGQISEARKIVRQLEVRNAVIATTAIDQAASNRLVRELTEEGIHVEISSALSDIAARRLIVRPMSRFPLVHVEAVRRHGWRARAKRTLDLCGAGFLLILTAPLLVLSALAVRLGSRGPILFRQERMGQDGTCFLVFKFRTMSKDAEHQLDSLRDQNEAAGPLFKMRDDPRITRAGRILRRYSIDELPQLWNVLRGEMSLVGPRPALPSEALQWDPEVHARVRVKPGITGMWQVRGRSNASFEDYVRLDLYYVDNWSLWSDLAILVKTIPAVVSKRGAF
jgi:exopolysaccharide biosynthesis polyprenyl glycosylphosphotransferase